MEVNYYLNNGNLQKLTFHTIILKLHNGKPQILHLTQLIITTGLPMKSRMPEKQHYSSKKIISDKELIPYFKKVKKKKIFYLNDSSQSGKERNSEIFQ